MSITTPIVSTPSSPPPAPFEIGNTGQEIYDNVEPARYAELDTQFALARFLAAISHLLDPIADVTRPYGISNDPDRWTILASPTRCPSEWLPVLAQWSGAGGGVGRPDAMHEAALRELIGPHGPGMWRGTRAQMIAAVRRFFPPDMPTQFIYFEERAGGNPYALNVFTYDYFDADPVQVEAAIQAAKPAGLVVNYQVRQGQAWFMLNQRQASWSDVNTNYPSWDAVLHDEPI